jgi:tRNA (mo5U34)-methyltransferase
MTTELRQGLEPDELRRRVAEFPYWYHKIALPGGVVTPGWAPLAPEVYRVPADLGGKRVLDVGAWDGYWSFEALRRGAREVLAIDDFSDIMDTDAPSVRRAWETFDLCREALGYGPDRCQREEMSVYDVSAERLGRFDVVFCFGVLYHLRHPLLALDRLAAVCDDQIYVESAILDDWSPYRGGLGHGYPGGQMVAEFYPESQYANNPTNWWVPTLHCLAHMVRAAGFDRVDAWNLADKPYQLAHCRGFARGIVQRTEPGPPAGAAAAGLRTP